MDKMTVAEILEEGRACRRRKEYARAEALYIRAAELGSAEAMARLGFGYFAGYFTSGSRDTDYARAKEWLLRAAELGDTGAMKNLGHLLMGKDPATGQADCRAAKKWFRKAAESGSSNAQSVLNNQLFNIPDEQDDEDKARYLQAAAQGDSDAMISLGAGYGNGRYNEGKPDYARAEEWYLRAAGLGNTAAMLRLGRGWMRGLFSRRKADPVKAEAWYLRAAEAGNADAMLGVGTGYLKGEFNGGKPDYARAEKWLREAAGRGSCEAEGLVKEYFRSPDEFEAEMAQHIRQAREGSVEAMRSLSDGFMTGKYTGGQPDYARAEEWLRAAAERGDESAMFRIGMYYQSGEFSNGTPDLATAEQWYRRAAEKGHPLARDILGYGTFPNHYFNS